MSITIKNKIDQSVIQVNSVDVITFKETGEMETAFINTEFVDPIITNNGSQGGLNQLLMAQDSDGLPKWEDIPNDFLIGTIRETVDTLSEPEYLKADGSLYLQSSYPELFSKVGIISDNIMFEQVSFIPPAGASPSFSFSPNGTYLAVLTSNHIIIYKRNGNSFIKLEETGIMFGGNVSYKGNITWDPSSTYLIFGLSDAPYIAIYKRNGDTFNRLINPDIIPPADIKHLAWDPTGTYLAVAHAGSSSNLTIYKRSGDLLFKVYNTGTTYTISKIIWNKTGNYLLIGGLNTGKFYECLKNNNGKFSQVGLSGFAPAGQIYDCTWYDEYLVLSYNGSPYIEIYKSEIDSGNFTKLVNPTTLATSASSCCAFDPTGTYLVFNQPTTPFTIICKRSGDIFTKLPSPNTYPSSSISNVAWDPTGQYIAMSSPYLQIYKNNDFDTTTQFKTPDAKGTTLKNFNTYIKAVKV